MSNAERKDIPLSGGVDVDPMQDGGYGQIGGDM